MSDSLKIVFDPRNGGIKSLVLADDPAQMNWVEGFETWGTLPGFDFVSCSEVKNGISALYRQDTCEVTVRRTLRDGSLFESYTFRNAGTYDLYFQRGSLGIFATFNDSYDGAEVCVDRRCDTHIWCGGAHSWIHARKMGPYPTDLALILRQGELDTYSVRRIQTADADGIDSDDRGDFILHPMPCHLLPGAGMTIEWEITVLAQGRLRETLLARPGFCMVSFEQETIFPDEQFELTVAGAVDGTAEVFCNGKSVPFRREAGTLRVSMPPLGWGQHKFEFLVNGQRFRAYGFCAESFDVLLKKRIDFILSKQQMLDPASPLYGAFLIYDNEEQSQYYSYQWRDHNTSGERNNMGLTLCRWVQMHPEDTRAAKALDLFVQYLLREIYEMETGTVHWDIGKHSPRIRLYNAAGLINFWQEMYRLTRDVQYLHWIARSIRLYYKLGGNRFYPNGTLFADAVTLMREAGLEKDAEELTVLLREHVENICRIGIHYPPHEVRFEQTITTPAVGILSAWNNLIEKDSAVVDEARKHIDILERFQSIQPDHRMNTIAIRHWDEFWFGKRRIYGDTYPHYLAALTARSFVLFAQASGEERYRAAAKRCLRNVLCFFRPDGSASCAYLYPFSVTMLNPDGSVRTPAVRGEFFDPFANDQDGALYLILFCGADILR